MQIDIKEAVVRTATVQIKTLAIAGKQMTLSVFRQLDRELLINDQRLLNGIPWGRVNYHPPSMWCPDGRHLHIIWSRGNRLYRDTVTWKPLYGQIYGELERLDQLFIAV